MSALKATHLTIKDGIDFAINQCFDDTYKSPLFRTPAKKQCCLLLLGLHDSRKPIDQ